MFSFTKRYSQTFRKELFLGACLCVTVFLVACNAPDACFIDTHGQFRNDDVTGWIEDYCYGLHASGVSRQELQLLKQHGPATVLFSVLLRRHFETPGDLFPHPHWNGCEWHYVTRNGAPVLSDLPFIQCTPFSDGLALVVVAPGRFGTDAKETPRMAFINEKGLLAFDRTFAGAASFSEGLALVRIAGKAGYIDTNGDLVIEPQFDVAGFFAQGLAPVVIKEQDRRIVGYIDRSGSIETTAPSEIDSIRELSTDGLAVFGKFIDTTYRYGYIDREYRIKIPARFDEAQRFSEGLAAVRLGKHWGYIDTEGKMVVPPQFTSATPFFDGYAVVVEN